MKPNRSIPAATNVPVLIYPDVREAVAWLRAAFWLSKGCRSARIIGPSSLAPIGGATACGSHAANRSQRL